MRAVFQIKAGNFLRSRIVLHIRILVSVSDRKKKKKKLASNYLIFTILTTPNELFGNQTGVGGD